MAIIYNPNKRIFTLHTKHSTYQMQVDSLGYLLHLYYGAKNNSSMEYVLTYADRGFSGNPYAAGADRTYSLDALPQEFPTLGTGDYRNIALDIKNSRGIESTNLLYKKHEIRKGKYALPGLPAVWADEAEAQFNAYAQLLRDKGFVELNQTDLTALSSASFYPIGDYDINGFAHDRFFLAGSMVVEICYGDTDYWTYSWDESPRCYLCISPDVRQ